MHPHFAGQVSQDVVAVFELGAKGRGRQCFSNRRGDANEAFVGTAGRRLARSRIGLDVADGCNSKN